MQSPFKAISDEIQNSCSSSCTLIGRSRSMGQALKPINSSNTRNPFPFPAAIEITIPPIKLEPDQATEGCHSCRFDDDCKWVTIAVYCFWQIAADEAC
ncbi:hypothetical protein CTI12_AA177310 [Artemisia annua]|uniref:Uncharacterized protein n=1 Tax=Artemisia annua TaxID=35608 RepID=A0A2U1P9N3_ARTAN|nr:hypothetical protein CTI12_AA177310 [Artemisia annua]